MDLCSVTSILCVYFVSTSAGDRISSQFLSGQCPGKRLVYSFAPEDWLKNRGRKQHPRHFELRIEPSSLESCCVACCACGTRCDCLTPLLETRTERCNSSHILLGASESASLSVNDIYIYQRTGRWLLETHSGNHADQ